MQTWSARGGRSWWLHRQKLRGCHWGHWDFHGFLWKPKPRAMGIKLANRMLKQWPTRSNKYLVICWWYRHVSRLSHRFAMFCSWLHNLKIWSTLFPVWAIIIVVVGKTGTFFFVVVFQSLKQQTVCRATDVTGYQPGIQMGNASNYS